MTDPLASPPLGPPTFPIALKLEGRRCLVVGSSDEARARALALAQSGAGVVLVGERPGPLAGPGSERVTVVERAFEVTDLDSVWLAVLADRDAELAERMGREAEVRRVFFCAIDQSAVGSFSHLAIARAGPLFAAIGSQGEAPALSRRLRELVAEAFRRARLGEFAERLAELRRRTPPAERRSVLNAAADRLRLEGGFTIVGGADRSVEGGGSPGNDERGG